MFSERMLNTLPKFEILGCSKQVFMIGDNFQPERTCRLGALATRAAQLGEAQKADIA